MRSAFFFILLFGAKLSIGQTVTTNPAIPSPDQPVTITFDVTGTSFAAANLNDVWLWAWLDKGTGDVNAPTNVNPATDAQSAAKVTRSTTNPNLYSITITATTFFNRPASDITTVGVLLKGRDWPNGQTADKFITFAQGFAITFAKPTQSLFFVNNGESIAIEVSTNQSSTITLKKGNSIIASSNGAVTSFAYTHIVTEPSGSVEIIAEANNSSSIKTTSFKYVIRTPTVEQPRPTGIIDGINYHADKTKATLCLWAPGKTSVFVLGDFNNWEINPGFQMKKHGERFWLEISSLTIGQEYGFQYLVDETVKIADPYADKILDPDDQYIPSSTYPNLKPYPAKALSDKWYFNRVAVLQTGQPVPYSEQEATDPILPPKEALVIYELLIRDFFANGDRNYQNLIDTIGYFKKLGVNAIELMPIMEFNGNEGWGYNPTFMFAPDKYYGTKQKLKQFIAACHTNSIAVILDLTMNHHDMPNPYVMMDFDFVNGKPESDNKWFNVNATHPFNVFFDMNHESPYTKKYLDTVTYYWLNEYHVDGFRFDLSKGFTQQNNPSNVDAWSAYDATRVALLKRMADKIWSHSPNAFIILEHLAVNTEEKELAEYRSSEGKGMLLWGKMTDPYNQNTMGYVSGSDISGIYHASREWNVPHLVGYMESHDEERLQYKNIVYGAIAGSYSVKDTLVGLSRLRAAATMFYTIPGPKMLWQFGELGYDYSINYCPDGSNNQNCRISAKPVRWDYLNDSHRKWLYDHVADLNRLRHQYDVFTHGTAAISSGSSLTKQITLKNNPYQASPSSPSDMNAVAVANFDLVSKNITVDFPHAGTWYDYYHNGNPISVTGASAVMQLGAGDYRLFTDVPIEPGVVTAIEQKSGNSIRVYPNPVSEKLVIQSDAPVRGVMFYNPQGNIFNCTQIADREWNVAPLPPGLFIVEVSTTNEVIRRKIIKK